MTFIRVEFLSQFDSKCAAKTKYAPMYVCVCVDVQLCTVTVFCVNWCQACFLLINKSISHTETMMLWSDNITSAPGEICLVKCSVL